MVKVTQVGGNYVVECPHCKGTSLCQHVRLVRKEGESPVGIHWFECQTCGKGAPDIYAAWIGNRMSKPTCQVCGGKGYSVVQVPEESVAPQSQDRVLSVNEFLLMVDEEKE